MSKIYNIPHTRIWVDLENVLEITEIYDLSFSYFLAFTENERVVSSERIPAPREIFKKSRKENGTFDPDVFSVEMSAFMKEKVFQPFFKAWCEYKGKR